MNRFVSLLAGLMLVLSPAGASGPDAEGFVLPPSVSFSSTTLHARLLEPKPLVLSVFNPMENRADLRVGVLLKLPSGLHLSSTQFTATGSNQMAGQFRVRPGEERHVGLDLWAEEPGSRTVEAQVTYGIEGRNGTPRMLQHTVTFEAEPRAEPSPTPPASRTPSQVSIDLHLTSWQLWLLGGGLALLLVLALRR